MDVLPQLSYRGLHSDKTSTTGNATFAVCRKLCRVPYIRHTAKVVFAVCCRFDARQNKGTRQTNCLLCAFDYNTQQTEAARQINYFAEM